MSCTAAELADLIGVSPRSITDLAKRGIVVRAKRGFDEHKSVRGYCDHLRKLAAGRGGESAIAGATAERARLIREQADAAALKNALARAEMLPAADVASRWSAILRRVRDGVLAASSRVAGRLPHLTRHDVSELDAELRIVLTELGHSADDR